MHLFVGSENLSSMLLEKVTEETTEELEKQTKEIEKEAAMI